jgi:hypothetical protein
MYGRITAACVQAGVPGPCLSPSEQQRHADHQQRTLMYFFFQILCGRGRRVPSSMESVASSDACALYRLPMDSRRSR